MKQTLCPFSRMRFEIECILELQIGMILAKQLDAGNFTLLEGATLGGIPITPTLDMPRKLDSEGRVRLDVFAFRPCSKHDVNRFAVGDIVELRIP